MFGVVVHDLDPASAVVERNLYDEVAPRVNDRIRCQFVRYVNGYVRADIPMLLERVAYVLTDECSTSRLRLEPP
jgi:hypothetical protein